MSERALIEESRKAEGVEVVGADGIGVGSGDGKGTRRGLRERAGEAIGVARRGLIRVVRGR